MKILIKVTKEILVRTADCVTTWIKAEDATGMHCAITHAVREIFPFCSTGHYFIYVCNSYEELLTPDEHFIEIPLPEKAVDFIRKFDRSSAEERVLMQPISFEIDVPNKLIEQIGISHVYKVLSESKTLEHIQ